MLELLYLYEYPISGAGRVEGEGAADENAVALTRAVCHEQNNARHKAPVCLVLVRVTQPQAQYCIIQLTMCSRQLKYQEPSPARTWGPTNLFAFDATFIFLKYL